MLVPITPRNLPVPTPSQDSPSLCAKKKKKSQTKARCVPTKTQKLVRLGAAGATPPPPLAPCPLKRQQPPHQCTPPPKNPQNAPHPPSTSIMKLSPARTPHTSVRYLL